MKSLLPLILLIVLGIAAYFVSQSNEKGPQVSERDFAYENVDDISRIEIRKVDWEPQIFVRKGDRWYVNDLLVADYKMPNLLKGITSTRIENLPPRSAHPTIFKSIKENGVQVKVFNKKGKKVRQFDIGPNALNDRCTYFVMEGSQNPFCMNISGFGGLRTRFVQNIERWRDVAIYNLDKEDIASVKVEYNKDYTSSFQIVNNNGTYDVIDIGGKTSGRSINENKVKSYLSHFKPLNGEGYDNGYRLRDSISALIPFVTLTVEQKDGEVKSARFFPMAELRDPADEAFDAQDVQQIEKYFVDISNGDFMVAQQRLLKEILRPYEYFVEEL